MSVIIKIIQINKRPVCGEVLFGVDAMLLSFCHSSADDAQGLLLPFGLAYSVSTLLRHFIEELCSGLREFCQLCFSLSKV